MNYVSATTSGSIDDRPPVVTPLSCGTTCLKLHSGSVLQIQNEYFGGTSSQNYISFTLDPDGALTGKGDSLRIVFYYNGRITSRNGVVPASITSAGGSIGTCSTCDPNWLSW